ncbi:LysR substrate-binding domain-containing protein [Vibrio aquimaris]|jgi:LysR family D-serine deaminase transcriptional activator|uniref:Glycine cleavage system transcriptional activator n=1 Tax=Vibrio aquimaris TaxID=2587862 RepID=A0A5P9CPE4_9VIBR|nr:LysR substrate-binding domain-containing protein [Vibrio aquimaris]QFT28060.1 Glycine cleavage system transcriptional activator [Vibrio aquimaris]
MAQKQQMLSNMYTFSVAGKCLSFTKTAEELFITQGAVSQRIKSLEAQLGFNLFVRMTRRLELTKEGERLLQALNQSLEVIFSELEDIKFNELRGELYIGAAPTFAQSWLLPRLPEFQHLYPNLNVKLRVKASRLNFQHEPVDIAIYYSSGEHPGFYHQKLFDEKLIPVCSPDYFKTHFSNENGIFSQLSNITFIHCNESIETGDYSQEWDLWLKNQNDESLCSINTKEKTYLFNHADMAMIAAKNGMGVGMGRLSLIKSSLDKGELVTPFNQVNAELSYDLICLNGQQNRPKNAAFIQWLEAQLQNSPSK